MCRFLLRASATLLVASRVLGQSTAAETERPSSTDRRALQQNNFNFETIDSALSDTPKSRPVAFAATFTNAWSGVRHPFRYPAGRAHWSPVVFASHSDAYSMWGEGRVATDGVERIAEEGSTFTLDDELDALEGRKIVLDHEIAPASATPVRLGDESSLAGETLCFDERHPLASAISMIAPSPDWFSGLYGLKMWERNADGDEVWYDRFEAYVYAWDAGTEEGDSFSLNNNPTDPKEGMFPFTAGTEENALFVSTEEVTCETREACDRKRAEMGIDSFLSGNFPTKGCFSKRERAYWSDGGTDEERSRTDLPGIQERILCNGDPRVLPVGIVAFELRGTRAECTSMSDDASAADSNETFEVRSRGPEAFATTDCEAWAIGRNRCRRNTFSDGRATGLRVRDLCPASCSGFEPV